MPIYEYICEECQARFELLRPSREASAAQPCPNCDTDSKRVMSQQWSAFVHRDGRQRQLPDDGGYWHLGQKVTKPITRSAYGIEHPEINRKAPDTPLTVEEMERYEAVKEERTNYSLEGGLPIQGDDLTEARFLKRMRVQGSARQEQVKRRVRRSAAQQEYRKQTCGN